METWRIFLFETRFYFKIIKYEDYACLVFKNMREHILFEVFIITFHLLCFHVSGTF